MSAAPRALGKLPRWAQLHRHRRSLNWGGRGSIQEEWANHRSPAEDGGAVGSVVQPHTGQPPAGGKGPAPVSL